ncbi:MAG TPA: glycine--tRNA ligase subunit beta [Clostridia bacterium]|nr:glycine--tRNA ligase subunit beta [Clostridia bacterium]
MSQDLLFEIGTEEIPARFMEPALQQLKELAEKALAEARLSYQGAATYGTPRRLCLYVTGLAGTQADLVKEVKGPAKKAAFDAEGHPTKAALGFAKSQGVDVSELVVKTVGNGEYVFATVKEVGRPAREILPELLLGLVKDLYFPKPMRWADYEFRFARPIHWLVALLGEEVIPVSIAGVTSDRVTYGHRFLAPEKIPLVQPQDYFAALEKAYVIVDQNKRKELIRVQLEELAARENGTVDWDEELLVEVTHLLEYPTGFVGNFDPEYLQLPEEVVITPMKEHQRYFPLRGAGGKLLPKFLAVRNGDDRYLDNVREGNEKVLAARLTDAHFFYQEDMKEPLENKVERLKSIVFQEKLGTVWEKVVRIQKLAVTLGQQLGWDPEILSQVQRTAYLAKADLVTNMVYEFPELQGIMGGYYARPTESPEVAQGIREHYQPRFSQDAVPASRTGIAVSMADKMDTIAGCFLAGLIPTGSQDPYALRRQALGICRIILTHGLPVSLKDLAQAAIELYQDRFSGEAAAKALAAILDFFKQRLENIFQEEYGFSYDVVDAVLAVGAEKPVDALQRARSLVKFMERDTFDALSTAFTRAFNLAKNAGEGEVEAGLLAEPAERELYESIQTVSRLVHKHLAQEDYFSILEVLATLREPIDRFFDQVMVMVEDEQVKRNRLALLQSVVKLARVVADFSRLAVK